MHFERGIVFAAALAGLSAAPTQAGAVSFNFTFANAAAGHNGTVTGTVSGLSDNGASQHADSLQITGNTEGFGLGEYVGSPSQNNWTLSAGNIVSFNFFALGSSNVGGVTCCSLFLSSAAGQGGLNNFSGGFLLTNQPANFTFTRIDAVPGPVVGAGIPGLVMALGGFLAWRRSKALVA